MPPLLSHFFRNQTNPAGLAVPIPRPYRFIGAGSSERDRGFNSTPQHQGLERPPAIRVELELVRDAFPDAVQDIHGPETTIFLGEIVPVALEIVRVRVNEIDNDGAADRPRSASILRFGDRDDALLAALLFLV
jgi:hypothetical protein